MSRLFGLFSSHPVNLSCNLSASERSDSLISIPAADGWGIGFFRNRASFLFKKAARPTGDQPLTNISEVISSNIFISHLRRANIGERKEANTQPFRWGNWLFAHQGMLTHFRKLKPRILRKLPAAYKKLIRGNTDSEHCFYLYLTMLRGEGAIKKGEIPLTAAVDGLITCGRVLHEICEDAEVEDFPTCNFLVTNGEYLLAARLGDPLYYQTRRRDDPADTKFFSKETGLQYELRNLVEDMEFTVVSSEELSASPDWQEIPDKHFISISSSQDISFTRWMD
ncbi:class II glutamine amidotransferase [candidate division KSB1 bacterium]